MLQRLGTAWRTYLIVTVLITVNSLIFTNSYLTQRKNAYIKDKQLQLLEIASTLERKFDSAEFNKEIYKINALSIDQDEKARMMNKLYQPLLMEVSIENPDFGMGIYSKAIDRIVAVGPIFEPGLLRKVTRLESLKVYETKKPVITEFDKSTGWNGKSVLNVAYPIYDGEIIGHTWASYKLERLDSEIAHEIIKMGVVAFILWLLAILTLYFIFYRLHQKLNALSNQIKSENDNSDAFKYFPELIPILDTAIELRDSIKKHTAEYQTLVENCPDSIVRFSKRYELLYMNPGSERHINKPTPSSLGKNIKEWGIPESLWAKWESAITYVFSTGKKLDEEIEYGEVKTDIKYLKVTWVPELDDKGQVETVLGISRDITKEKKLELEMARFERLNLIGEMAAGIGHEVRNPMTTVRGYLQLFQRNPKFESYSEQIATMIEELDRANSIITEYLSLAKDRISDIKRGNLTSVVNSLFPLIQSDAFCIGHTVQLECSSIPDIMLDEKEIRQLILNMTRNALESMKQKGILIIKTYCNNSDIVLEFSDTGIGIPKEIFDNLGIPFLTTKDNGTGLGLSICYRVAQRHGAKIDVETSSNGTTFRVLFEGSI